MADGRVSQSPPFHWWIIEYLLRSLEENHLVNEIFSDLPLDSPIPPRVVKAAHIRLLASRPISEDALFSFEFLHEYNLAAGAYAFHPSLLPLIQSAYLHALVGSTLRPLGNGDLPEFFDAVHRIWTMRIEDLLGSYAKELASHELVLWKRKMEAASAAGNGEARDMVLMEWTVEEGIAAVRKYLVKELEVLGKPVLESTVLESMADENLGGGGDCSVVGDDCEEESEGGDSVVIEEGENLGGVKKSLAGIDYGECVFLEEGRVEESLGERDAVSKGIRSDDCIEMAGGGDCTVVGDECEENIEGDDTVAIEKGESSGGVERRLDGIDCGECVFLEEGRMEESPGELDVDSNGVENSDCFEAEGGRSDGFGRDEEMTGGQREPAQSVGRSTRSDFVKLSVSTPVVNRVKGNLKKSCQDLQKVVEDPLPNAKKAASRVVASRAKEVTYLEKTSQSHSLNGPEQSQNVMDVNSSTRMGPTVSEDANRNISSYNLRDRKRIVETCEWEDESLESESDIEASPAKRPHLPSPKIARVSPLKPVNFKYAGVARRRRRNWTTEQVDALLAGVSKHGAGNWKIILNDNPGVFEGRTEIDLKDKWRNLNKH